MALRVCRKVHVNVAVASKGLQVQVRFVPTCQFVVVIVYINKYTGVQVPGTTMVHVCMLYNNYLQVHIQVIKLN